MRDTYFILGASGFLGRSFVNYLLKNTDVALILYDKKMINTKLEGDSDRCTWIAHDFMNETNFDVILCGVKKVFHFISTSRPNTQYDDLFIELIENISPTIKLLNACVKNHVNQITFLSSGGTVYGIGNEHPHLETDETNPICSYGIHKLIIEKYLQVYYRDYGLDYRIIRLSNPYGGFQDPSGGLGVVSAFVYRAVNNQKLVLLGDGTVVRDYIYIDDAVAGIYNISHYNGAEKLFNLGSGIGTDVGTIISYIRSVLDKNIEIEYQPNRRVDVPYNVLNILKYQSIAKGHEMIDLKTGIKKLVDYYKNL